MPASYDAVSRAAAPVRRLVGVVRRHPAPARRAAAPATRTAAPAVHAPASDLDPLSDADDRLPAINEGTINGVTVRVTFPVAITSGTIGLAVGTPALRTARR